MNLIVLILLNGCQFVAEFSTSHSTIHFHASWGISISHFIPKKLGNIGNTYKLVNLIKSSNLPGRCQLNMILSITHFRWHPGVPQRSQLCPITNSVWRHGCMPKEIHNQIWCRQHIKAIMFSRGTNIIKHHSLMSSYWWYCRDSREKSEHLCVFQVISAWPPGNQASIGCLGEQWRH